MTDQRGSNDTKILDEDDDETFQSVVVGGKIVGEEKNEVAKQSLEASGGDDEDDDAEDSSICVFDSSVGDSSIGPPVETPLPGGNPEEAPQVVESIVTPEIKPYYPVFTDDPTQEDDDDDDDDDIDPVVDSTKIQVFNNPMDALLASSITPPDEGTPSETPEVPITESTVDVDEPKKGEEMSFLASMYHSVVSFFSRRSTPSESTGPTKTVAEPTDEKASSNVLASAIPQSVDKKPSKSGAPKPANNMNSSEALKTRLHTLCRMCDIDESMIPENDGSVEVLSGILLIFLQVIMKYQQDLMTSSFQSSICGSGSFQSSFSGDFSIPSSFPGVPSAPAPPPPPPPPPPLELADSVIDSSTPMSALEKRVARNIAESMAPKPKPGKNDPPPPPPSEEEIRKYAGDAEGVVKAFSNDKIALDFLLKLPGLMGHLSTCTNLEPKLAPDVLASRYNSVKLIMFDDERIKSEEKTEDNSEEKKRKNERLVKVKPQHIINNEHNKKEMVRILLIPDDGQRKKSATTLHDTIRAKVAKEEMMTDLSSSLKNVKLRKTGVSQHKE